MCYYSPVSCVFSLHLSDTVSQPQQEYQNHLAGSVSDSRKKSLVLAKAIKTSTQGFQHSARKPKELGITKCPYDSGHKRWRFPKGQCRQTGDMAGIGHCTFSHKENKGVHISTRDSVPFRLQGTNEESTSGRDRDALRCSSFVRPPFACLSSTRLPAHPPRVVATVIVVTIVIVPMVTAVTTVRATDGIMKQHLKICEPQTSAEKQRHHQDAATRLFALPLFFKKEKNASLLTLESTTTTLLVDPRPIIIANRQPASLFSSLFPSQPSSQFLLIRTCRWGALTYGMEYFPFWPGSTSVSKYFMSLLEVFSLPWVREAWFGLAGLQNMFPWEIPDVRLLSLPTHFAGLS